MTYQQIQYFLEIAQCGNITKSAERLYMSTPSLSKYIKAFESELGFPLFTRKNRGVELTEEGRVLYESIERPFYDFLFAYNQATSKSRNQRESIIIAIGSGEHVDPRLMRVFNQFNQVHRDEADLIIRSVLIHSLGSGLVDGEYNISIVNEMVVANNARISKTILGNSHVQLLLPKDHRLATQPAVDLADLQDEKFIISVSDREHNFADMISKLYGFTPNCIFAEDLATCAMSVAAGFGVTMIPDTMLEFSEKYVCRKELKRKIAPARYCAAWLEDRMTPLMHELVEAIKLAYANPS